MKKIEKYRRKRVDLEPETNFPNFCGRILRLEEVERSWNGFRVERIGEEMSWRRWEEEMREKIGLGLLYSRVKKQFTRLPVDQARRPVETESKLGFSRSTASVDRLRAENNFLFQAITVDRVGRPGLMPGQVGRPGRLTGTAETR